MIRKFITLFILTIFIWLIWSFSGRNTPLPYPTTYLSVIEEINPSDSLTRNIVGIQPFMEVTDYFSQQSFQAKISEYIVAADAENLLKKNTLIVFPEYIGTWLLLIKEKHSLAEKSSLNEVISTMIYSNAFDYFLGYLKTGDEENKEVSSIFRMKAKAMLAAYYDTFSQLALETETYIAAGSIVLPEPTVINGEIFVKLNGPLYNASFLFGPDGKVIGSPILKAFPNSKEDPYLTAATPENLPIFDLPFGKTAILLCDDSWHEESYINAINESAEIILVSSFCTGNHSMTSKWNGYDGKKVSEMVELEDVGNITTIEAWEKYSLPSQIKNTKAQVGMNVFFRGDLWDIGSDGQPIVLLHNTMLPVTPAGKAGVWSLNF
ncbi:nitrilase-related carbon-nitrogen hydrolase [Algoriphagus sp.]|uniref:nitrilase-related carbon-nitrogen hydrolase n=1 Tax=Algoriphagus sp. TaxID=1872435 RepID=UPI00326E7CD3